MTAPRRYTEQMPFVGTPAQRWVLEAGATDRSIAAAVRRAINDHFGLVDETIPEDDERYPAFSEWVGAKG